MSKMTFCQAVDKLAIRIHELMLRCDDINKKPILESEFGKSIGFGVDLGVYTYYYGITIIDHPLDGPDVLLICGLYGGGNIKTASIRWWMSQEEIRNVLDETLRNCFDFEISKDNWVEIE